MILDLSSLERALESLGRAVTRAAGSPQDEELRDAVIQRFEYCYELCWKMVKRRIEADAAVPADVDAMSFHMLMREAAERGLVRDVTRWLEYREQRSITAHTYDAAKARSVYQTAGPFLADAQGVMGELRKRNHD
jgi:nucleotidyltransferase substrate binding protein (TIGR01987 family)